MPTTLPTVSMLTSSKPQSSRIHCTIARDARCVGEIATVSSPRSA
jgi:hypothetical protein